MALFRISRAAQTDLAAILTTSLERWGERGRARYAALLTAAMSKVAATPRGPTTKEHAELGSGIRSFHLRHARGKHGVAAPVHVLYYAASETGAVEIVRVLHERMEPLRHLGTPMRTLRARPTRRR